MPLYCCRFL